MTHSTSRTAARQIGKFLQPAVKPVALAVPVGVGGVAGTAALRRFYAGRVRLEKARNPPFQTMDLDPDGDGVPNPYFIGDTRTGESNITGDVPVTNVTDNNRSEERVLNNAVMWGALGLAGLGAVILLKGGK